MPLHLVTAGKSHGHAIIAILSGVPAGITLSRNQLSRELSRRRKLIGRSARMRLESDDFQILGGLRHGETTGNPLAFLIPNAEAKEWERLLDPFETGKEKPLSAPRPGHADLAGALKFAELNDGRMLPADIRDVSERASARETVARAVAGAVCKHLLSAVGMEIASFVFQLGRLKLPRRKLHKLMEARSRDELPLKALKASRLLVPDTELSRHAAEEVRRARSAGTTLGGGFVVMTFGAVPGLGSFAQPSYRLDGRLAGAMNSIPGVKAAGFGQSLWACTLDGRAYQDVIARDGDSVRLLTNRDGGLTGGVTNGAPVVLWALMKPLPTQHPPLSTVDLRNGKPIRATKQRADVTTVPAAAIIAEAEMALVLADAVLEEFGGSHLSVIVERVQLHRKRLARLFASEEEEEAR